VTKSSYQYWEKRWGREAVAEGKRTVNVEDLTDLQKRNLAVICSNARKARLNEETGEREVIEP